MDIKLIMLGIIIIIIMPIVSADLNEITLTLKDVYLPINNDSAMLTTLLYDGEIPITDGQCEIDIFRADGAHIVNFRSALSYDNGEYKYLWTNIDVGSYIMVQYCTYGFTLDDDRIYLYANIEVT